MLMEGSGFVQNNVGSGSGSTSLFHSVIKPKGFFGPKIIKFLLKTRKVIWYFVTKMKPYENFYSQRFLIYSKKYIFDYVSF